jgi:hypothetical protein
MRWEGRTTLGTWSCSIPPWLAKNVHAIDPYSRTPQHTRVHEPFQGYPFFINMCLSSSSFALKTRSIRSGWSYGVCPGYNSRVISSHFGLHVIVRKMSCFPNLRAMASKYLRLMSLGHLINDEGITIRFLIASDLPSLACRLPTNPW